jgi:hypothetical protein
MIGVGVGALLRKYIKLKSSLEHELFFEVVHVALLDSFGKVDAKAMAELDEPSLGGLEGGGLAAFNGKPANLFFVS